MVFDFLLKIKKGNKDAKLESLLKSSASPKSFISTKERVFKKSLESPRFAEGNNGILDAFMNLFRSEVAPSASPITSSNSNEKAKLQANKKISKEIESKNETANNATENSSNASDNSGAANGNGSQGEAANKSDVGAIESTFQRASRAEVKPAANPSNSVLQNMKAFKNRWADNTEDESLAENPDKKGKNSTEKEKKDNKTQTHQLDLQIINPNAKHEVSENNTNSTQNVSNNTNGSGNASAPNVSALATGSELNSELAWANISNGNSNLSSNQSNSTENHNQSNSTENHNHSNSTENHNQTNSSAGNNNSLSNSTVPNTSAVESTDVSNNTNLSSAENKSKDNEHHHNESVNNTGNHSENNSLSHPPNNAAAANNNINITELFPFPWNSSLAHADIHIT